MHDPNPYRRTARTRKVLAIVRCIDRINDAGGMHVQIDAGAVERMNDTAWSTLCRLAAVQAEVAGEPHIGTDPGSDETRRLVVRRLARAAKERTNNTADEDPFAGLTGD